MPAASAMPMPLPVLIRALVELRYTRPYPPVANTQNLRGETLEPPLLEIVGDQPVAAAVCHGQPRHRPLVVDLDAAADELLVERVQQHVSGAVGGVAGPREAGAAERTLGDGAFGEAAEGRPPALELADHLRRQPAHLAARPTDRPGSRCP